MSKQYGLILRNKKPGMVSETRPSIFDEDSDTESPAASRPTGQSQDKFQYKLDQQKAIAEDPTVYQYDEIYDEMITQKTESKLARKDIDKKPKYINRLLATAERRKRENERRIERQVQKEREAEGEEFKDKESFVTSSYKKKLEELKQLEEQEKREEYLEAIGDVTKQGNLDGFYRHLYDQKVNYEDRLKKKQTNVDDTTETGALPKEEENASQLADKSDNENNDVAKKANAKQRKYRARKRSHSDSDKEASADEETAAKKTQNHLPSNLDADSDFSVDSSSSDEDGEEKKEVAKSKDGKIEHEGERMQLPAKGNVLSDNAALAKKPEEKELENAPKENEAEKTEEVVPKKPKVDIWKKRTVGRVFDEALIRYFERKSARGW